MATRPLALLVFAALVILQWFVQTTNGQNPDIPCKQHYVNTTAPLECYHNGTCMVTVFVGFDPFPFCSCISPYAGMQCEYLDISSAGLQLPVILGIVIGCIAVVVIISVISVLIKRKSDKRRRQTDRDVVGVEGGEDHGGALFDPVAPGAGPA